MTNPQFAGVIRTTLTLTVVALVSVACGGQRPSTPESLTTGAPAVTIHTYLDEWSVRAEPALAKAGSLEFMAHNQGTIPHELVVVKTSLPADQLPVGPNQTVVEGGAVEVIGEIEPDELSPSMTATKTMELTSGSYVLLCNIEGHYSSGMRAAFTVTA